MKPTAEQIINGNNNNRMAFSLSAMTRETVKDEETADPTYEDFINSVSGTAGTGSERAKYDLDRLKNGDFVLQPTWSPMDIATSEDVAFNIDDVGDQGEDEPG
jgi:hypothetical protein